MECILPIFSSKNIHIYKLLGEDSSLIPDYYLPTISYNFNHHQENVGRMDTKLGHNRQTVDAFIGHFIVYQVSRTVNYQQQYLEDNCKLLTV